MRAIPVFSRIFSLFGMLLIAAIAYGGPAAVSMIENFGSAPLGIAKVWEIADAGNGWTFFATRDAVYQFNGSDWQALTHPSGLEFRSVTAADGKIYAGSINEAGYFTPDRTGNMVYTNLCDKLGTKLQLGNVWKIFVSNGALYFVGDTNILRYIPSTGHCQTIATHVKIDCAAFIDGVLYIGTDRGIKHLMGDRIATLPGCTQLEGARIREILPYQNGLMIVTADRGIYRHTDEALSKIPIPNEETISTPEIFSADISGNLLALGTVSSGVFVVDLSDGSTEHFHQGNGLADNTVLSLGFQGSDLWAGMDRGVQKILTGMPIKILDNASQTIGSGYVAHEHNGDIYLGTNRGLWLLNDSPGNYFQLPGSTGQVWSLQTVYGDLLCGHDRGLFMVEGNTLHRVPGLTGCWGAQPLDDGKGNRAIAGTYNGINVLEKTEGGWKVVGEIMGFEASANNFVQPRAGELWVANGSEGVTHLTFNPATFKLSSKKQYVKSANGHLFSRDTYISLVDGKVYFCTSGGVFRYNPQSDSIEPDPEFTRLLGGKQSCLRLRQQGNNIFALSDHEIVRASLTGNGKAEMMPRLPVGEGRPSPEANPLLALNDSVLMYASTSGYTIYDFTKARNPRELPSQLARINSVEISNGTDSVVYRSNFLGTKHSPEISYSDNSIRIRYGAPDAARSEEVSYRYRLNGGTWSDPTFNTVKEFTNLHEGHYRFEVKAIGYGGKEASDYFEFSVLPPWYRSWWAIIIYILLTMAVGYAAWRIFQKMEYRKADSVAREKDRELARQQSDFEEESRIKDSEIMRLESEKLQNEIRHKSQEMANTLANLAGKNEILISIKEELRAISNNRDMSPAEQRKALLVLQGKIDGNINSDQLFKRFEEEFDLVHSDFTKRLKGEYPSLTGNEILMCSYLMMNVSTKEIAPLLNITVRGVETMRYRIRKKFGLEREESLTKFLNRFEN